MLVSTLQVISFLLFPQVSFCVLESFVAKILLIYRFALEFEGNSYLQVLDYLRKHDFSLMLIV